MADDPPPRLPRPFILPEPALPYRRWYPALEHHATALGYLCFAYSHLEFGVAYLLGALIGATVDVRRAIIDATGSSISTRCDLLLKIASTRGSGYDYERWFDALDDLCTHIKTDISPKRNRYIHDRWMASDAPVLIDERAILARSQSRQPKSIPQRKISNPTVLEIWELIERAEDANADMMTLYHGWLEMCSGKLPSELPEPRRPRRTEPPPNDPAPKARAKRRRRPQPSDPSPQSDE